MFQLITAKTGVPHVTSQDDVVRNCFLVSKDDRCILNYEGKMALQKKSPFELTIHDGYGVVEGKYFKNVGDVNLVFTAPALYKQRTDAVCIKIDYNDADGTETITHEIYKGAEYQDSLTVVAPAPEVESGSIQNKEYPVIVKLFMVSISNSGIVSFSRFKPLLNDAIDRLTMLVYDNAAEPAKEKLDWTFSDDRLPKVISDICEDNAQGFEEIVNYFTELERMIEFIDDALYSKFKGSFYDHKVTEVFPNHNPPYELTHASGSKYKTATKECNPHAGIR